MEYCKFQFRAQKSQSVVHIVSQLNQIHTIMSLGSIHLSECYPWILDKIVDIGTRLPTRPRRSDSIPGKDKKFYFLQIIQTGPLFQSA